MAETYRATFEGLVALADRSVRNFDRAVNGDPSSSNRRVVQDWLADIGITPEPDSAPETRCFCCEAGCDGGCRCSLLPSRFGAKSTSAQDAEAGE